MDIKGIIAGHRDARRAEQEKQKQDQQAKVARQTQIVGELATHVNTVIQQVLTRAVQDLKAENIFAEIERNSDATTVLLKIGAKTPQKPQPWIRFSGKATDPPTMEVDVVLHFRGGGDQKEAAKPLISFTQQDIEARVERFLRQLYPS